MLPLPEAEQTKIHYPPFHKLLAEKSRGKDWTWCDVLPDAIVRILSCLICGLSF